MPLLVSGILVDEAGRTPERAIAAKLGVAISAIQRVECVRVSVDARWRRPREVANYRVVVQGGEAAILAKRIPGVRAVTARDEARWALPTGRPVGAPTCWTGTTRPIVVGAGPAGLFTALCLARAGARPLLLERGRAVEERTRAVHRFWRSGTLDPENNALFGEGGAGAFSDGKLNTRRRDGTVGQVLSTLVELGAHPSILTSHQPHLGTDRLRHILRNFRQTLMDLGVEIRFSSRVADLMTDGGRCRGVVLADGQQIEGSHVFMAAGHSARDTFALLLRAGASAVPRPIAIGVRAEHPQRWVDQDRYGRDAGHLPAANYRLAWNPPQGGASAYSFCMCPGGLVVAATEAAGLLALNGMSYSFRCSPWANAALVVQVGVEQYPGSDPLAGVRFQVAIERAAHSLGGGDWRAPAQGIEDFQAGRVSRELPRTSYPLGTTSCDMRALFPAHLVRTLRTALLEFDRKMPGFCREGVMLAPETRTTSPVRFLRGENRHSSTLQGLLPVGEGAGYGGGIISAAIDGWQSAQSVLVSGAR